MPRVEREATIVWEGTVARGRGLIEAASSGAFSGLPVTLASRVGTPEGRTSPEELLAAAHAACLAMSFATELAALGHPPGRLELDVHVVLDEVAGRGHQIVASSVAVLVTVPGLDGETLAEASERADAGCPFSSLLRAAGAQVRVEAALAAPAA